MNSQLLRDEANEIIREGFDSLDQPWRSVATIKSVDTFRPDRIPLDADGENPVKTYARMLTATPEEIESGSWRERLKGLGRGAAESLNYAVDAQFAAAGHRNGVTILFLNGQQYPRVEEVTTNDEGRFVFRGYYDFGVTAPKATAEACV